MADHGFELVDVEAKPRRGGMHVRLTVDKPGGIGLDELSEVSEEVSRILDVEDPITSRYTLEVSSPGLDRPLATEADFRRALGHLARVETTEPVHGKRGLTGRLAAVGEGSVRLVLEKEKGAVVDVPLALVERARLEVEFKHPGPKQ